MLKVERPANKVDRVHEPKLGSDLSDAPPRAQEHQPPYVKEALRGLTRAQRQYVLAGCLHGDVTMATVRALQRRALFYLKITSPNGRCGHMALTPLGETVRGILQSRRHDARDGSSHQNNGAS